MLFFKNLFFTPGAKRNFLNLIGHLQGLSNHILAYNMFSIPWNIDGVQVTRFGKETSFFNLIWLQGVKWKFRILTAHLQDMPKHILEYQLSTSENVDVVQVTNFTEKKKSRFTTLIWPLGIKWKFRHLIAHLQDMATYLLEYHRSSS